MKNALTIALLLVCCSTTTLFCSADDASVDPSAGGRRTLLADPAPALLASKLRGSRLRPTTVPFVANEGQFDASIAYFARTGTYDLFVSTTGQITHVLPVPSGGRVSVVESFIDAHTELEAQTPSATRVSFFTHASPWHTGLQTYASVRFHELYPGVDMLLTAGAAGVEKIFTVTPGVSADVIRLELAGHQGLEIDAADRLVAHMEAAPVHFSAPVAWQEVDGRFPRPNSFTRDFNLFSYCSFPFPIIK